MLWNFWACMPTTSGWWVDKWLCTFFFKQFSVLNVHCITSHCQLGNLHELWKLLSQQPQGTSPCQSFVNELKGKSPFTTTWQFAFIVILNMKACSSTLRVRGWHASLLSQSLSFSFPLHGPLHIVSHTCSVPLWHSCLLIFPSACGANQYWKYTNLNASMTVDVGIRFISSELSFNGHT